VEGEGGCSALAPLMLNIVGTVSANTEHNPTNSAISTPLIPGTAHGSECKICRNMFSGALFDAAARTRLAIALADYRQ
jgi:hypothetical protein